MQIGISVVLNRLKQSITSAKVRSTLDTTCAC
jgi:hypothetical protein